MRMNRFNQFMEGQHPEESTPPVVQEDGDPFRSSSYRDVNVPDMPIQYGGGIAESLLNDNEVPEDIKEKYWYIFHKDNVLTFLDDERKKNKLLNFDIMKIDTLATLPYYDYDFHFEQKLGILRNIFETKLDRARGIDKGNIKNERLVLQSQFSEARHINEGGQDSSPIREGFFKRLLGRR